MRLTTEEKVCMALRHRCIGLWTEINTHSQCTFKGVESAVSMYTNISMYTFYYAFKKTRTLNILNILYYTHCCTWSICAWRI